jgi:hypothetical protein
MWVYRELAAAQPAGEGDADAYLAGVETPTMVKEREDKQDTLRRFAAYSGVELP